MFKMVPKPENCNQNNVKIDSLFEKSQKLFSGWGFTLRPYRPRRQSFQTPVYWTLDHLSATSLLSAAVQIKQFLNKKI